MLGVLASFIEKLEPLLPEFTIRIVDRGFGVYHKQIRYSLGLLPKPIGELEQKLAVIKIAHVEDDFVVTVNTETFSLTVPNSGRSTDKGREFDWRLDDAATEVAQYLNRLAKS